MLSGPVARAVLSGARAARKQAQSAKATPLRNFSRNKGLLFFSMPPPPSHNNPERKKVIKFVLFLTDVLQLLYRSSLYYKFITLSRRNPY